MRVAAVNRGDLVRDLSADGRVIAVNSPTLYAVAGGTVALTVVAGDVVKQGQALAVIDSPELRSRQAQKGSSLAAEAARATTRRAHLFALGNRSRNRHRTEKKAGIAPAASGIQYTMDMGQASDASTYKSYLGNCSSEQPEAG